MKVLVVPKWYPWPERPVFGIFCREHARALATRHEVVVLASLATPRPDFGLYRLTDEVEEGIRTLRVRYRRPLAEAVRAGVPDCWACSPPGAGCGAAASAPTWCTPTCSRPGSRRWCWRGSRAPRWW